MEIIHHEKPGIIILFPGKCLKFFVYTNLKKLYIILIVFFRTFLKKVSVHCQ